VIVNSSSHDPWYNLALEEGLLRRVKSMEVILYLWQNHNTVVIGRNQNAWKECRCKEFEEHGGKLARRLSGGGAVYHDLGNLNFTFIMNKDLYDLKKQLSVILEAVRSVGIEARFSGRNDLVIGDRKFSGNAFYLTRDCALHHGTILVDTDIEQIVRYLQVSEEKIRSKGIDSIRSRVVNLREFNRNLGMAGIMDSVKKSFQRIYGGMACEIEPAELVDERDIEDMYAKYASWEWRYGETPDFDVSFQERFAWGEIEIGLSFQKGYIVSCMAYSDAMDCDLIQRIPGVLRGVAFKAESIGAALENIAVNNQQQAIIDDIKQWLGRKAATV